MIDTFAPTVAIISPKDQQLVPRKTEVSIIVSAGDDAGPITSVLVFVDGQGICTMAEPPYHCRWLTQPANRRLYRLQASAQDAAGNWGTSPEISVTSAQVDTVMDAERAGQPELPPISQQW